MTKLKVNPIIALLSHIKLIHVSRNIYEAVYCSQLSYSA
jgi:hypothetical protein